MSILKPTMNLRFREANDDELYRSKQKYSFAIIKMEHQTIRFERYYVLEQKFESPHVIDGKRETKWIAVPIADESENG